MTPVPILPAFATPSSPRPPRSAPPACVALLSVLACLSCRNDGDAPAARSSAVSAVATRNAEPAPRVSAVPSSTPRPPVFEGTAGIVERGPGDRGIARMTNVRSARHDGFDRVVFEFAGEGLPGYHVEYIDKPVRKCGSGETTPIRGDGWLEVRFSPVEAHDEKGAPTIEDRDRPLEHPVVQELELTCDFEAVVTWVLGTASPNHYRVLELREPTRLVIDVRHDRR